LAIAPDAAVLAGQFGIIALVLVVVMIAIRVLLRHSGSNRVFTSTPKVTDTPPSTRTLKKLESEPVVASTQQLPPATPSEASS
jgi:hypothetical protein